MHAVDQFLAARSTSWRSVDVGKQRTITDVELVLRSRRIELMLQHPADGAHDDVDLAARRWHPCPICFARLDMSCLWAVCRAQRSFHSHPTRRLLVAGADVPGWKWYTRPVDDVAK